MRKWISLCAAWTLVIGAGIPAAPADNPRVLDVVGRGVEGRKPYRGGGRVRFLSVSLPVSLVHYDGGQEVPAKIGISYEVRRTAPIVLDSRFGSEYWNLYNYTTGDLCRLHSRERIDLRSRSVGVTQTPSLTVDLGRGPGLRKGLCGIRGRVSETLRILQLNRSTTVLSIFRTREEALEELKES